MRGVGGRQERDRDGWSGETGCTGAQPRRERQSTDAQRRSGRGCGKMTSQEEVGEGGIISKDGEERLCVCVRDQGRQGAVERE